MVCNSRLAFQQCVHCEGHGCRHATYFIEQSQLTCHTTHGETPRPLKKHSNMSERANPAQQKKSATLQSPRHSLSCLRQKHGLHAHHTLFTTRPPALFEPPPWRTSYAASCSKTHLQTHFTPESVLSSTMLAHRQADAPEGSRPPSSLKKRMHPPGAAACTGIPPDGAPLTGTAGARC